MTANPPTDRPASPGSDRPPVSVIVPFAGTDEQLDRALAALERLTTRPGDELILADNRPSAREQGRGRVLVVAAGGLRTPGHARNRGASSAGQAWLVFLDADTRPAASLLDDLFDPPPAPGTAVLAGAVRDVADRPTLAARYGVARAHMSQEQTLERARGAYAQTANCAVRRDAFDEVGGFAAGARAGEDADLCFRLLDAGWRIEARSNAVVEHVGRDTVRGLLAQLAVHGSGAAWLERRYPGMRPGAPASESIRRFGHHVRAAAAAACHGDRKAAGFAVLDLAGSLAFDLGRLIPNHPRRGSAPDDEGRRGDARMSP